MRTVRLRGGLGNQLFGLAFAHSMRHLSGEPVAIDVGGFRRDRYGRAFITKDLAADLGLEVESQSWTRAALRRLRGRYFDAYWQDETYIADPETIRARIRTFLDSKSTAAEAHDIVIHHRAYAEERVPGRRRGPAPDYVARAIEIIESHHGQTTDIIQISDNTPGADPFVDMAILLRARTLILANSSFSWWAGYCGDATLVAYPARGGAFHYPTPARRFVVV